MTETDKKPKHKVVFESPADTIKQTSNSGNLVSGFKKREQLEIINWLKGVQFQKQLIGGINEQDVWKKIHQLNEMYEAALKEERIRYDVMLQKQRAESNSIPLIDDLNKEN